MAGKRLSIVVLVLLLGGFIFYVQFEYTLVSDIREALAGDSQSNDSEYGALLFNARGCSGCHALPDAGSESTLGPGLAGIGSRLDASSIRESIANPSAQLTLCGSAPCQFEMPEFGEILTEHQIDALVVYLSEQ